MPTGVQWKPFVPSDNLGPKIFLALYLISRKADEFFRTQDRRKFCLFYDGHRIAGMLRAHDVRMSPESNRLVESVAGVILEAGAPPSDAPIVFESSSELERAWAGLQLLYVPTRRCRDCEGRL